MITFESVSAEKSPATNTKSLFDQKKSFIFSGSTKGFLLERDIVRDNDHIGIGDQYIGISIG